MSLTVDEKHACTMKYQNLNVDLKLKMNARSPWFGLSLVRIPAAAQGLSVGKDTLCHKALFTQL